MPRNQSRLRVRRGRAAKELKEGRMKRYNVIMAADPGRGRLLMCRRVKEPFLGKYNMVGGHIEPGESDEEAAYRELEEETGIDRSRIRLTHVMDFLYRASDMELQVWAGRLREDVPLREEENPLEWIDIGENFFDYERFAGNGNIGHILIEVLASGALD